MEHNEDGFTLIEVMVAIMVITIGILSVQMMQVRSIDENSIACGISAKSMMAASVIEGILALKYNDVKLLDTDGDGTNQDENWDGRDDQDDEIVNVTKFDEEFGLRNSRCCPGNVDPRGNAVAGCDNFVADQCTYYDDYNIYWNIAVDHPVDNTKTIRIIVVNSRDQAAQTTEAVHRAEYTYIKDNVI